MESARVAFARGRKFPCRMHLSQLRHGDIQLRKSYLKLFVEVVEVGEREINIRGSKAALADAGAYIDQNDRNTVPFFMEGWRASKGEKRNLWRVTLKRSG
jgi:hypothetical protein